MRNLSLQPSCVVVATLLAAVLLPESEARAFNLKPDRVLVPAASYHIEATHDFQEINPGAILVWEHGDLGLNAGAYYNSFGDISPTVGASFTPVRSENETFEAGLFANVAYYPDLEGLSTPIKEQVFPMAGLHVRYGNFYAQAIPFAHETDAASGVISIGVTFSLK